MGGRLLALMVVVTGWALLMVERKEPQAQGDFSCSVFGGAVPTWIRATLG